MSSADPRRALASGLHADDYVTRSEYDALNRRTKSTAPRDPDDASAPKSSTWTYNEFGQVWVSSDFGGLQTGFGFDAVGRATSTMEDPDGFGGIDAVMTGETDYDETGRVISSKDRNQVGDTNLGVTATTYDELGRATDVVDASGSSPNVSSTTEMDYDALNRQTSLTVGGLQTTATSYDLGGRAIEVDDGFACSTAAFDYRDLTLTETSGLVGGSCAAGAETREITHTYDGLGRLTRSAVTAGTDASAWTFSV